MKEMKIALLGCGRVGQAIIDDLLKNDHFVSIIDLEKPNDNIMINKSCEFIYGNVLEKTFFESATKNHDLIVNSLPGNIGFQISKETINNGKNLVDISFFPENCAPLESLAKQKNVIAAIDCGIAPGLWNMILAHYEEKIDKTYKAICYVGGLPKNPKPPFYYQAPFSPSDVIEEYIRPARLLINGDIVTKEALSDIQLIDTQLGTLEAFNTDGLRTLLHGMKTPTIVEKTMRYPGHANKMKFLRDCGFFDNVKEYDENNICTALDMTSKLLFQHWTYDAGEKDITLLYLIIDGQQDDKDVRKTFKLYDEAKEFSSMARTTGYTATAVVDLINKRKLLKPGLYTPEKIGRYHCNHVLNYIKEKEIKFSIM